MLNPQHNLNQVKRLFEEVFTKGDLPVCNELISDNIRFHDPACGGTKMGLKLFKEMENSYKQAFPDKKAKIDEIFVLEDRVVVRWTVSATHSGELKGSPASDNKIQVGGISIYRFENGKIAEVWQNWDRLGLLEQIGEVRQVAALHG